MPDMPRMLVFLLTFLILGSIARAQDTLPRFSVAVRGSGKILVSWHNPFTTVTQISIQRSSDSLKDFTTLLTVPDPTLPENGAVDAKATHPNYFYRLFVVLEKGSYFFSHSQRPHTAVAVQQKEDQKIQKEDQKEVQKDPNDIEPGDEEISLSKIGNDRLRFAEGNPKQKLVINAPAHIRNLPSVDIDRPILIKKGDSVIGQVAGRRLHEFRDSILRRTRDTLLFIDGDTVQIRPYVVKEVYRISSYVFTGKYGNVHLYLPDAGRRHYSVKFFDDNDKLLFELSAIKDPSLILDKTNFIHAGWFRYELYEDNQLKERNKLFIPKEF
jgi:hypothetical protein